MSLLMDALKKAEEAKRKAEAEASKEGAPGTVSAHPASALPGGASAQGDVNANAQRGLPELPSRLELLDAEFHTAAPSASPPSPPPSIPPSTPPSPPPLPPSRGKPNAETVTLQERERASAQNLFAAKQPEPRSVFPIIVGAVTLIALVGIGIYFWLQLKPSGGVTAQLTAQPRNAPISTSDVTSTPLGTETTLSLSQPRSHPPSQASLQASLQANSPTSAPVGAAGAASRPERAAAFNARLASAPPPAPASPIRITSSHLKVNPAVAQAYQAFSAGDLVVARREYERALRTEPKNSDALHGLAAISLRQGQANEAEDYYLRALEADPKDATAQAALLGLSGQVDPVQSESRLKTLLASQPTAAPLHFALGNLYAKQSRWNEAQQAYFRAYTADAGNPDYLFNLAVSLEQLRQPTLALQYYQNALAAAAQRPAAFDRNQAVGRVRELQQ